MKKKSAVFLCVLITVSVLLSMVSFGYELPQKHSSDSYTDPIPEVIIPDFPEQEGILVYFNAVQVPVEIAPVYEKNVLYLPLGELFPRLGLKVVVEKEITVTGEGLTAVFEKNGKKGTVNGKEVTLTANIKKIKGNYMVPADFVSEVLNAKVWFDEFSDTFVISTGTYKNDDILRIINYKFWMNGEPFYEISFNKWDLFPQISSSIVKNGEWASEPYQIEGAEDALKILRDNGFTTIRVFATASSRGAYFRSSKQKDKFYEACDIFYDLCDKYGIQVNVCLSLPSSEFVAKGEDYFDLFCDPESASRQNLYTFLEEYIPRYKDRHAVLMWEIVNEGNLQADIGWTVNSDCYSIYQLGRFYDDCARKIKELDPVHLITGGDSLLRAAQWHLYLGVKQGMIGSNWTRDTLEQRLMALWMIHYGLDVVSEHYIGSNNTSYATSDTDPTEVKEDHYLAMKEVRAIGKVLYNGEMMSHEADEEEGNSEEYLNATAALYDEIIDAGVQLSHWWTFHTDRNRAGDKYSWQVRDGGLLDLIVKKNQEIKERWVVNAVADANTANAWAGSENTTFDLSVVAPAEGSYVVNESGCNSIVSSTALLSVVFMAGFVFLKRKH